jgi:hypothetical protein
MAGGDPDQVAVQKAPLAFKAWESLRGAVNVSLRVSLSNANKLTSAVIRGK